MYNRVTEMLKHLQSYRRTYEYMNAASFTAIGKDSIDCNCRELNKDYTAWPYERTDFKGSLATSAHELEECGATRMQLGKFGLRSVRLENPPGRSLFNADRLTFQG
jgi:hypothetical protein